MMCCLTQVILLSVRIGTFCTRESFPSKKEIIQALSSSSLRRLQLCLVRFLTLCFLPVLLLSLQVMFLTFYCHSPIFRRGIFILLSVPSSLGDAEHKRGRTSCGILNTLIIFITQCIRHLLMLREYLNSTRIGQRWIHFLLFALPFYHSVAPSLKYSSRTIS